LILEFFFENDGLDANLDFVSNFDPKIYTASSNEVVGQVLKLSDFHFKVTLFDDYKSQLTIDDIETVYMRYAVNDVFGASASNLTNFYIQVLGA